MRGADPEEPIHVEVYSDSVSGPRGIVRSYGRPLTRAEIASVGASGGDPAVPDAEPDPELTPDADEHELTVPPSTEARKALRRAEGALRHMTVAETQQAKREAFDAAAGMRRANAGTSGRYTPPARSRSMKAQQRELRRKRRR